MNDLMVASGGLAAKIHVIRGQRVMRAADLAGLYGVTTSALMQAVKRNKKRFPPDFCFQLTRGEHHELERRNVDALRSQSVISKRGGTRHLPHVFTELGVSMLSSVLHSERAIAVNVVIMRTFVQLRTLARHNADLLDRVRSLESTMARELTRIWRAFEALVTDKEKRRRRSIGFRATGTG